MLRWLFKTIVSGVALLYGVGVLIYLVVYAINKDQIALMSFLTNFAHWLLLPTIPLFGLMIWQKQRYLALLTGVGAAAFMILYGGLFLPRVIKPTCDESCIELRVMTFNIRYDTVPPEEHFETYRQSGADLILIQELSAMQAAALAENLKDEYPYRALFDGEVYDNGLLSKYPIVSYDMLSEYRHLPFYTRFVVDVDGHRVVVIGIHSRPPASSRTLEQSYLHNLDDLQMLADIAEGGNPIILAGDLNAVDQSSDYAMLREVGLEDTYRVAGWGFGSSWPRDKSVEYWGFYPPLLVRIDYIFVSEHFAVERVWVGGEAGSDHHPVLADLFWDVDP